MGEGVSNVGGGLSNAEIYEDLEESQFEEKQELYLKKRLELARLRRQIARESKELDLSQLGKRRTSRR